MRKTIALLLIGAFVMTMAGCGRQQSVRYSLVINSQGQGTVTPSDGLFEAGTVVELRPTAEPGWVLSEWSGADGNTVVQDGTAYKIIMDRDKTITAVFVPAVIGRIIGAQSGAGVPGMAIQYDGGATVTDSQGYFTIQNASGSITITPASPNGAFNVAITPISRTVNWPCEPVIFTVSWMQVCNVWGTNGKGNGQFNLPGGIDVDSAGNIYVADSGNDRVQKFAGDGTFLAQWGAFGSGTGQFFSPKGVAVDSFGNVYIADNGNHRIQKFMSDGAFLAQWGGKGSGNGQFNYPTDVAVDSAGHVYVVDSENHRIQKFESDGTYLAQWGVNGAGNGQFKKPYGVTVDCVGNVYVADSENYRIQKFTSDGVYLAQWGTSGFGDGKFGYPCNVAADSAGNIYVADLYNYRIQKFTGDGDFLAKWGSQGSGAEQFGWPVFIAIDSAQNVFVSDAVNHRIQKFGQVN